MDKNKNYPVSALRIGRAEFTCNESKKIDVISRESEILEIRVPQTEQNFNGLLIAGLDFTMYEGFYYFTCDFSKIHLITF